MLRTMRSESDCCCEDGGILSCTAIATCLSGKRIIASATLSDDSDTGDPDILERQWSRLGGTWLIEEGGVSIDDGAFCAAGHILHWTREFRYPRHAVRISGDPDEFSIETLVNTAFRINVQLFCSTEVIDDVAYATLTWVMRYQLGYDGEIRQCVGVSSASTSPLALPVTAEDLLDALNAAGASMVGPTGANTFEGNYVASSVELLGAACGPCTSTPPTISFEMDNENVLGIDPCTGLEGEIDTGCTFTLSATTEEGDAPLRECFWEDGVVGCDRTTITLGSDCGEQEITLGVEALDDNGCVGEAEESFTCCRCCTPSGGYSITEADFDEFAIPGGTAPAGTGCSVTWGGVDCTDGGGVHTVAFAHQYCFYTLTFEEGETTDCGDVPNPVQYKVEWDGLTDHDGNPLADGCYEAGDIVNFRHDPGGEGFPACLSITAMDSIGCAAEPSYEPFPYAFSVPPGTDPETYEPECVRELLVEFYCGDWEG